MSYCTSWCKTPEDITYHNTEWGRPIHDDRILFECLMLEVLQCGLSWQLILKKRAVFRCCFDDFEFAKIALYTAQDKERILNTEQMIQSALKINAVIQNAQAFLRVRKECGSFDRFLWNYTGGKTILYDGHADGRVPTANGLSARISSDLKKRGFTFLGAVTVYAYLQACGLINDHSADCPCFSQINARFPTVALSCEHELF